MFDEQEYISKVVGYVEDNYKRKILPKLNLDIYMDEILTTFYNEMPKLSTGETFEFTFDLQPASIPLIHTYAGIGLLGRTIKYPQDFWVFTKNFECSNYTKHTETAIKNQLSSRGFTVEMFDYGTNGELDSITYSTDFSGATVGNWLAKRLEHAINSKRGLKCKTDYTTSGVTAIVERVED